jgi:hypothetical protein
VIVADLQPKMAVLTENYPSGSGIPSDLRIESVILTDGKFVCTDGGAYDVATGMGIGKTIRTLVSPVQYFIK